MTEEVVVDASIAVRWFEPSSAPRVAPALEILKQYQAGDLRVVVPPLLFIELINVAGRQWRWRESALHELATRLDGLLFDLVEPDLERVATWVATGLTAYDAVYVALAEQRGLHLLTDDRDVLDRAKPIARRSL